MISADFAPNEQLDDALASLKILFMPWRWQRGKAVSRVKTRLKNWFPPGTSVYLYFTARSGIYHILKSLKLAKDSEILVQAFTCEAVILPILENGFKPVYVDIEPQSYSMSISDLERKYTDRTKVLILQHTFGQTPTDRSEILAFAKSKKLFVIEDLAQGFDPKLFKTQEPRIKNPNTTILLSFGRSKMFSSVFGGAVVTANKLLQSELLRLEKVLNQPSYITIFKLLLYKPLAVFVKKTYPILIGRALHKTLNLLGIFTTEITRQERRGVFDQSLNRAYPNALAYLLLAQLNKFDQVLKIRLSRSLEYKRVFGGNEMKLGLIRYPVVMAGRDRILDTARAKNIYLGTWHDPVVSPRGIAFGKMQYVRGSCPIAEVASREILNLPTLISDREAKRVVKLFESNKI